MVNLTDIFFLKVCEQFLDDVLCMSMEYYRQYHSLLFSIAYRMLGSFQDAEDIIQELFADLQEKDIGQIDHIQALRTILG